MEDLKISNFIKERDEVLLSLDKERIIEFSNKFGITVPDREDVFWYGVHTAIIATKSFSEEQRKSSLAELKRIKESWGK